MRVNEVADRCGRRLQAEVRCATTLLPDGVVRTGGVEVRAGAAGPVLVVGGRPRPVTPLGRDAADVLRFLADQRDNAVVEVAAGRGDQFSVDALLVLAVRRSEVPVIVVPDVWLETLPHGARVNLNDWFEDEFVLDGGLIIDSGGQAPDLAHGADLIGRKSRWTLVPHAAGLCVDKTRRDLRRARDEVWRLLPDAPVRVVRERDIAAHVALAPAARDAERGESAYLDVWAGYQAAERDLINDQARRLEPLVFETRAFDRASKGWRFRLARKPSDEWFSPDGTVSLAFEEPSASEALPSGRGPRRREVGELARIGETDGRWWAQAGESFGEAPPLTGTLVASVEGDKRRLERRDQALEVLRTGVPALPDLRDVLEGRGRTSYVGRRSRWASTATLAALKGRAPTEAQRRAIEVALDTPDIALIQGPPGTGKTTVIHALTTRLHDLGRHPVLLTSYQHEAVLRAIDGVAVGGVPAVRLGGRRDEAPALRLRPMRDWLGEVRHRSARSLGELAQPPVVARLAQARRLLAHWRTDAADMLGARALVDEVRRLVADIASEDVHGKLDDAERLVDAALEPVDRGPAYDAELIRARLGSQRTTAAAFEDDGWLRARDLRRVLGSLPIPEEARAVLERACAPPAALPEGFDAALDAIRQVLEAPVEAVDRREAVAAGLRALDDAIGRHAEVVGYTEADAVVRFLERLDAHAAALPEIIARYAPAIAATLQQSASGVVQDVKSSFDTVIVDEAARANPLDLLIVLVSGRRLVLVGDQQQLPHMLEPRVEQALEHGSDRELAEVLRQSFFGRLWEMYAKAPPGGIPRCVRLDRQFRMHPVIGDFISEQFYGGGLENGVDEVSRAPDPGLFDGHPVAWFDVQRGPERGRYHREEEVQVVADLVKQALRLASEPSIGVISFYRQQVERIARVKREEGWPAHRVEVGTVDAFQGREFDVVILSTVRRGRSVGFLRLPNRLNVAMSRAMRTLVVVGDAKTVTQIPSLRAFHDLCQREGHHVLC